VTGLQKASFEAQGPMRLEAMAEGHEGRVVTMPIRHGTDGLREVDWAPLLPCLLDRTLPAGLRAATFHCSLAQAIADLVRDLSAPHAFRNIGLTGGVFQNARLVAETMTRLPRPDHHLRLHRRLPCNDASISLGQIVEHAARTERICPCHSPTPTSRSPMGMVVGTCGN
jgi:hydrogenase maturation protein HypF